MKILWFNISLVVLCTFFLSCFFFIRSPLKRVRTPCLSFAFVSFYLFICKSYVCCYEWVLSIQLIVKFFTLCSSWLLSNNILHTSISIFTDVTVLPHIHFDAIVLREQIIATFKSYMITSGSIFFVFFFVLVVHCVNIECFVRLI